MIKAKKNEHGFSAVEGLIVLVVVVAIVGVGLYVHKHRAKSDAVKALTAAQSTPAPLPSGTSNAALQSDQ